MPSSELPTPLARETFALLCGMLPPPSLDSPHARAVRDAAAMAALDALHPADAFQARLAARIVAMEAHAADSLRLAGLAAADPAEQRRCRAQATAMARQADAGLRALLRVQSAQEKELREMQPAAMQRAGYWFRDVSTATPEPAPERALAEPAPSLASEPAGPENEVEVEAEAEARRYAQIYPERAARIRAWSGLPPRLDFGPPEPAIVEALIGRSTALDLGRAT